MDTRSLRAITSRTCVPRPAFSVITPTFNRQAMLLRAIRSVQAQTFPDYEHLIIDDASTDQTAELVASIDDPRIRYVRLDRWQGANAARNLGMDLARAEWLTFLDSDDEYLPHRLESLSNVLESSSHHLLLSSFLTIKRGRLRPAINPPRLLTGTELEEALVAHTIFIAGSAITVRRRTLRQAGGFDPAIRRMQDREVLLRLARHCGACLMPEPDWLKHPSPDSISAPSRGYVAALAALAEAHPPLARRYRALFGYLLARRIVRDAFAGRWTDVLDALRTSRRASALHYSFADLLRFYRVGAAQRQHHRQALERPAARLRAVPIPPEPTLAEAPALRRNAA